MDGYAVRFEDVSQGITLPVVDHIPAGVWPERQLMPKEAARIFTGAPLPPSADTVILQENCEAISLSDLSSGLSPVASPPFGWVKINHDALLGEHVRQQGEEVGRGVEIASIGDLVTPGLIGLCAAQGHSQIGVFAPPQVTIIETGDELKPLDQRLKGAEIYATNGITLAAMLEYSSARLHSQARCEDEPSQVARQIRTALEGGSDLVITTGGVSVGDHDPLHRALELLRAERHFWRVKMKPGKPVSAATILHQGSRRTLLSLPGNPVSAVVSYLLFVHPLLQRAAGVPSSELGLQRLQCQILHPIEKHHQRAEFLRVRVLPQVHGSLPLCELTGGQSSAWISSVMRADGLLALPAEPTTLNAGSEVEVALFPWAGGLPVRATY